LRHWSTFVKIGVALELLSIETSNFHLTQHCLDLHQIDQLRSEVATKEELRALTQTIDGLVKIVKDYYQEVTIMSARMTRMEAWIQQAARQIGVDYKP
jgi:hypothetical protein